MSHPNHHISYAQARINYSLRCPRAASNGQICPSIQAHTAATLRHEIQALATELLNTLVAQKRLRFCRRTHDIRFSVFDKRDKQAAEMLDFWTNFVRKHFKAVRLGGGQSVQSLAGLEGLRKLGRKELEDVRGWGGKRGKDGGGQDVDGSVAA
ncbi:hypothetical protein BAUCODRAFT_23360 [Baudoinia panamericana UAMH 10762]|uniref:Uncharacterized protein n=1 Tax=Baudoinia panamericana (strain UAMH 10762) TaxID=717646 RepID=M2MZA5_BAUPA|nr:uncharacterized protein BAUCODRAFT_23360 [Baudoinia panamericana UAMH 10762]EMC96943.1 hypothetical protein BAUCODRAFT_23360 [Baudoinia panamericana UAMH 10762]